MTHTTDIFGRKVSLPNIGETVLRDGYQFIVSEIRKQEDISILASIVLKGASGEVEVGYYDFLLHKKP